MDYYANRANEIKWNHTKINLIDLWERHRYDRGNVEIPHVLHILLDDDHTEVTG
jgi:hypothetical protein